MQVSLSASGRHDIDFFSRYVFSIVPRCKKCGKKVSISPSNISRWLWVLLSVIMLLYLFFMRPPNFNFTQYVILWSLMSFGVRRYMIFATESERTPVNSEMVFATVNGRMAANELTKNISISVYYIFFMFLSYTIVSYMFQVPLAYSWVAYAIIFSITPIGYYDPEVERCTIDK